MGTPAFALYTLLVKRDNHRSFETGAFTRLYFFDREVPTMFAGSPSVEVFPGIRAVCEEERLSFFPSSEED
ncbi:hypothetical protein EDD75_0411 [Thermodesulfitimonas autotrophica]|uniref:Uncharacterized protein n=1 Tax=Thermodesulfitimonas autotrophica TaxID=1894989 RepID=A0A3N5AXH1_9THEO|nr:hypothetical protein [Thermodesulfitimonas autotrophica]RPF49593.1 hypothetical protein EDD75_0411 [Thermodesulfitimonas autotrophica]